MNFLSSKVLPVLMICMALLPACNRQEEASSKKTAATEKAKTQLAKAPPAPLVVVKKTETRTIQPGFEFPAAIEAVETAAMHPQVAGVIKSRHVTPGGIVQEGDLLMEVDDADYRIKIMEIQATLAQAKANAAEAEANFKRSGTLKTKGYISVKDYDTAKARSLSARALIEQVQAKLQRAELDLEHTRIYAPFSGRISAANYAVGDYVAPTSPNSLFELVKTDPVYAVGKVNMTIYENFVLKRTKLREQGKEIPQLELNLKLTSGQIYAHKGTFVNWDNTATGSTGTIAGRAVFDNPDGLLLPGLNVTLLGRFITPVEGVMVPQKAVSQDQQGHYVLKVDNSNVVQRQNIEVGIRDGFDWTVLEGLTTGDRVIVEGLQKVRPGIKVNVSDN